MRKRFLSMALSIALSVAMVVPSFAVEVQPGFADDMQTAYEQEYFDAEIEDTNLAEEIEEEQTMVSEEAEAVETGEAEVLEEVAEENTAENPLEAGDYVANGETVHFTLTGDTDKVIVNGQQGVTSVDAVAAVTNLASVAQFKLEAVPGYMITDLMTNVPGFMGQNVAMYIWPESNMAELYNTSIPRNVTLNIKAVEATTVHFQFNNVMMSAKDLEMGMEYNWLIGDDLWGGTIDEAAPLNEYGEWEFEVPNGSQFLICDMGNDDPDNYSFISSLDRFDFYLQGEDGKPAEKITSVYDGGIYGDWYPGNPAFTASGSYMSILIVEKGKVPVEDAEDEDVVHLSFTEGTDRVKINGETGIKRIDVDIPTDDYLIPVEMEALSGYKIFALLTNIESDRGYFFEYNEETKKAYLNKWTIPEGVKNIEVKIVAEKPAKVNFKLQNPQSEEGYLFNVKADYLVNGMLIDGVVSENISGDNSVESCVPMNSTVVITSIARAIEPDSHWSNAKKFVDLYHQSKDGKLGAAIVDEYRQDDVDGYLSGKKFVADSSEMTILLFSKMNMNKYSVSANNLSNVYIGTEENPSANSFAADFNWGEDCSFYVKAAEGYLIDEISYTSGASKGSESFKDKIVESCKYTIPSSKIVRNILVDVKASKIPKYFITNVKGNYTIKSEDDNFSALLAKKEVSRVEQFSFVVKPNAGWIINGVSYTSAGNKVSLDADGGNNAEGYTYTIPAGLTADAKITVATKQVFDLSKAIVTMYFDENKTASTSTIYDVGNANSEKGITPSKVEVRDASKNIIDPKEYEISYKNNSTAGTAYLLLEAASESIAYSGSKKIPYTIKGISVADTKKVNIELTPLSCWNNTVGERWNYAEVTVTDISNPEKVTELEMGTDYTLLYSGPIKSDYSMFLPGVCSVTIVGMGGYEGTKTLKYDIPKPDFAKATNEATFGNIAIWPVPDQDYTASAVKPSVLINYNGVILKEGADYVIKKYTNNINAYEIGEGEEGFNAKKAPQIVVQGLGNFKGSKTVYFKINKVALNDSNIDISIPSYKYTGSAVNAKPVVKMLDENGNVVKTFKEKTDYTLTYEDNVEASTEAKAIITATAGGSLSGSITKDFVIANKNIADKNVASIALIDATGHLVAGTLKCDYTGKAVKPGVAVVKMPPDGNEYRALEENKDYIVSYSNNVNVGTKAKVTITGCGQYYGSVTKTFTINKKTVNAENVSNISIYLDGKSPFAEEIRYDYTGYPIKPEVTVRDKDYELILNKDYSVSYKNNTNVTGDKAAEVTITFKGNYAGVKSENTSSLKANFAINSWDIADAAITVDEIAYTGKARKPAVKVVSPKGGNVNPKVVKLVYSNNINAASKNSDNAPIVKITPANINITAQADGCRLEKFTIDKADITKDIQKVKISAQTYKGENVTPKVTIKFNGKALQVGKDYEIEYINNESRGVGVALIYMVEGSNYTDVGPNGVGIAFVIK